MNLLDVVQRTDNPQPWSEGEKIPWNSPGFSERMLKEHLSQDHDAASRRFKTIDNHIDWIHNQVLKGIPTRILDLGCGPGLYTNRLAELGHSCVGIDFSPASITYASEKAKEAGLDCTYYLEDIRKADFGKDFGLVMSIFGEFNVFRPKEAKQILEKSHQALVPDGYLLLEPHTYEAVVNLGENPAAWHSVEEGLFSEEPHLYLQENFWDQEEKVAIQRYFIITAESADVTFHSSSTKAYTEEEYRTLLQQVGFDKIKVYPSVGLASDSFEDHLIAILAEKEI
ncbi:MAG: methyltransferase domain-containing protein [Anaerolineales bacterium]|nr:methyltransferase domain-containing protein [Anaerolineales bacterium]